MLRMGMTARDLEGIGQGHEGLALQ